ncbi:MAG: GAF domain-containing sensor histidine kinase [Anaerolineales bacterium]|nr:GAF domain-containing sensor histidine kinase [Anaerolineales bacterium]
MIKEMHRYETLGFSVEELSANGLRAIDTIVKYLQGSSSAGRDRHLVTLNNIILQMGCDSDTAVDALFLLKKFLMSLVRGKAVAGLAEEEAGDQLDACLRHSLTFLVRHKSAAAFNELREQQSRTAMLLEVVRGAASTLELDGVLRGVADAIRIVVNVPRCGLSMIDEERGVLMPRDAAVVDVSGFISDSFDAVSCIPFSNVSDLTRDVLKHRMPAVCIDVETEPHRVNEWVHLAGIKSILAIPFLVSGRIVAMAFACSYETRPDFDEAEISLARGIADTVALAIDNARLHEETTKMAIMVERDRLAREMHDRLAQDVGALQLKASEAALHLAHGHSQNVQSNLGELQDMITEVHTELRESIFDLRSSVWQVHGFALKLQEYAAVCRSRFGVDVQVSVRDEVDQDLAGDVGFQVMRIVQESLTNVRKHAGTRQAKIHVERKNGKVRIIVSDNGRGFDREKAMGEAGDQVGLQVMRERAETIGGTLEIISNPGRGTCVILLVPSDAHRIP